MATRQPLIVDDLAQVELASPVLRDSGMQSIVAVPLLSGDRLLGVMHAGSCQLRKFTSVDAELLGILADRLGLALSRVRLFEEQVRLAKMCSFFAEAAKVVAEGADLADALERLADLALTVLGDICVIDVIDAEGVQRRLVAKHRDPTRRTLLDRLRRFDPDPESNHPAMSAIRTGKPVWSPVVTDEFLRSTTVNAEHLALARQLGYRSYMAVPLASKGDILGSLTLVSCTAPFEVSDVEFAQDLAHQVEAVLLHTRQKDYTLQTSHILQASLLPAVLPAVDGLVVDSRYMAATRGLDVGGDFYDLLLLPSGKAGFMIGDVVGHDRGAAALMGQLRSAARAVAGQVASPPELVAALQSSWDYLGFDRIATALFGDLNPVTGEMRLASAGHYPPIVVGDGVATLLSVEPGPPLGAGTGSQADSRQILQPGQVLLLYTDGAIDERRHGVDRGITRLIDCVAGSPPDASAVCDRVIEMLGPIRDDDVALLAIQFDPR
jgi:serine/threonine-protein kinase RsbW